MGDTLSISPQTVTVLGYRVKPTDPAWTGLNWERDVILREQSTLMMWAIGKDAPPDHHLDVLWMHPSDQANGGTDDPDNWCRYRVRPRNKKYRFEPFPSEPTGWRLVRARP